MRFLHRITNTSPNSNTSSLLDIMLSNVVSISLKSVQGTLTGGTMYKSSEQLLNLANTSASASEEVSATAISITQSTSNANEFVSQASASANDAMGQMESVSLNMSTAEEKIRELASASNEIQQVVSAIGEIAEQTNLLALNAAIEAARAGDAGRGFAVVADEVKKLSVRSQDSTKEIINTINKIQENIKAAVLAVTSSSDKLSVGVQSVKSTQENMTQVSNTMEHISISTQEQQVATEQISQSLHNILEEAKHNRQMAEGTWDIFDELVGLVEQQRTVISEQKIKNKVLYLAKADHALWKKKIMDFESGRLKLSEDEAGDHTLCRLGKWYYNEGIQQFRNTEIFKKIEEPHKKVHECARQAINLRAQQPNAEITPVIESLNNASDEVVTLLDQLINDTP